MENEMSLLRKLNNNLHMRFIEWQGKRSAEIIDRLTGGSVLEIGCGHGALSNRLIELGKHVIKTDYQPTQDGVHHCDAHAIPFEDKSFELIACVNTLEHLHTPALALKEMRRVGKKLYLSWTPWWSPFGGHEFAPLHYFGKTKGSIHQLGTNLFKTTVKETVEQLEQVGWKIISVRPRYWPALKFLSRWHWTREWATWNVEIICN